MVLTSFHSDALAKLCSKDQLELLDSIDCLRLQGINNYVSLPQIIVCGDQSSGKSSVLEAISGVSFPVKSNLCTRFPTELVLRRAPHTSAAVSIVPCDSRSESEQNALSGFQEKLDDLDGISGLVDSAKSAMGISTHGKAFSKDLLRIEITGPDRPHLTIVDLPGLIHSETKQQAATDVELIQDVVQKYMKQPRSIILAVVSAKNDFANQVVLKLARSADATGKRTLGVITKPDTLKPGSDSEALYVSLARNQEVEFRLGWHVLKNMDSELGKWTLVHRDTKEAEFFSEGAWKELPESLLGVNELRGRLSKVLLRQIAYELPSLIEEIEAKRVSCLKRLEALGEPRSEFRDQQLYLFNVSQTFQILVKASVDGTYNHPFFTDAKSVEGYEQRLRAVIQNLNRDFAKDLARHGHRRKIVDSGPVRRPSGKTTLITRDEVIADIQHRIERTRGRELPGAFSPMIEADLFLEQSRPWEAVALRHIRKVWIAAKTFLGLVLDHIADPATSAALFREIFKPALAKILETLKDKTAELLKPHQHGHPITYNSDFVAALSEIRAERRQDHYTTILEDFFNVDSLDSPAYISKNFDLRKLVSTLADLSELNMDRSAASDALDRMNAYYTVNFFICMQLVFS